MWETKLKPGDILYIKPCESHYQLPASKFFNFLKLLSCIRLTFFNFGCQMPRILDIVLVSNSCQFSPTWLCKICKSNLAKCHQDSSSNLCMIYIICKCISIYTYIYIFVRVYVCVIWSPHLLSCEAGRQASTLRILHVSLIIRCDWVLKQLAQCEGMNWINYYSDYSFSWLLCVIMQVFSTI